MEMRQNRMAADEQSTTTSMSGGDASSLDGTTLVGRYKVERRLGEGGMGTVYLVQHTGIRKRVALKLLRAEFMAQPDVLARFEREAMAAAAIDHPNVAAATDFGRTEDGRFFLVLEYVEGRELRAVLDQSGPLPLGRALFIARQIASALARAHEVGIAHRDLKPENIMLIQRDGHGDFVKVLDFGLAQVPRRITEDQQEDRQEDRKDEAAVSQASKLTKVGDIFGTPAYMSPEQSVGEKTDIRTDLYSLGIILFEMLAGARPFKGKSLLVLIQHHLITPPPLIREHNPAVKVPGEVDALVQRLLAKELVARIQQPQDVIAEIDRITAMHQIVWPAASASSVHSLPAVANDRHSTSLSRIWTALRTRPAAVTAQPGIGNSLTTLPQNLRGPLQRVPRWLRLTGAALLIVVPIGLGWHVLRSRESGRVTSVSEPAAGQRPKAEVKLAPQSALDAAVAQGPDAVEVLASRYPADPRIQRVILRNHTSQKRHVEAMRTIAKLATIEPRAGTDPEVVQSIVAAVQSGAEAVEAVAALLEQDLGEDGVDLLYDLTVKQTGARWKTRLNQSLTKPEVLARASPAARIALDLRNAKRCEAKRDLLPRAVQEGDRRALVQLTPLVQTQGCGFLGLQDCWSCLRKTPALQDAIRALESHADAQKQP